MDDPDLDDLARWNKGALDQNFDDDDYDDIDPVVVEAPTTTAGDGTPIPDLERIPQDHWLRVLRAHDPYVRRLAAETPPTHDERVSAQWVLLQLDAEDSLRRQEALRESAPPPTPRITRDVTRRRNVRQVSFRLSHHEHQELERVAYAYGTTSARLARMLTIRGVRRVLEDS